MKMLNKIEEIRLKILEYIIHNIFRVPTHEEIIISKIEDDLLYHRCNGKTLIRQETYYDEYNHDAVYERVYRLQSGMFIVVAYYTTKEFYRFTVIRGEEFKNFWGYNLRWILSEYKDYCVFITHQQSWS